MKIGNKEFYVNQHTYIMGILNVTQDSFSDGGKYLNEKDALIQVEKMIDEGADIIDVGGESTRPGYTPVPANEEITRVTKVIKSIKSRFDIPISLDTQKAVVARTGIEAGADLINDIWGLTKDPDMGKVIADANVACILMHNRETNNYVNFLDDVWSDLAHMLFLAKKAGIDEEKIILDPGIGFQKTTKQSLQLLKHMDEIKNLGQPWMLAHSRKSVIGDTLGLPVDDRLEGTLAISALAARKGATFIRVHDVLQNKRVIDMVETIYGQD